MFNYKEVSTFFLYGMKERIEQSLLGLFWIIALPVILFTLHYVIFKNVLGQAEDYMLYLSVGFFPWHFYKISHDMGVATYVYRLSALRQIPCSHESYTFSIVMQNAVIMMCLWPLFIFITNVVIDVPLILKFISSLLLFIAFVMNSVHLFALLQVFYRDLKHVLDLVTKILFFTAPILYRSESLGDWAWLTHVNPLAIMIKPFYITFRLIEGPFLYSIFYALMIVIMTILLRLHAQKKLAHKVHCHEIS